MFLFQIEKEVTFILGICSWTFLGPSQHHCHEVYTFELGSDYYLIDFWYVIS